MDQVLVFDVGGTNIRAGLYDRKKECLLDTVRISAPGFIQRPALQGEKLREELYKTMLVLATKLGIKKPDKISVAFPGPVHQGIAISAPTLWGTGHKNIPVATKLALLWPEARISLMNDLTAAGYCFRRNIADDFCVVTVSSGIGLKVFVGGKPVLGPFSQGGEIGHWQIDSNPNAPLCDCGGRGHLGAIASGRSVAWHAQVLAEKNPAAFRGSVLRYSSQPFNNCEIVSAFLSGDKWAKQLIRCIAAPLGKTLAAIHLIVGTVRFVIMGGFATALGESYIEALRHYAEQAAWDPGISKGLSIELGDAGDDAGLIGAGKGFNEIM